MKSLHLLFLLPALAVTAGAAVRLASPFTDHMVLQRDQVLPVWGTADAGEKVTVRFAGQTLSTQADPDGHWRIDLQKLAASAEARDFVVEGSATAQPIRLTDVLVGEVWLISGQSNMVFTLSKSRYPWAGVINEESEIAAANFPLVRMFTGAEQKAYTPQATIGGAWQVCTPANAPAWSAIGYFFARDLHRELNVPVGILALSYGASCAHAWIRREAMLGDPAFKAVLDRFDEIVTKHVPPTEGEIKDWEKAVELAKAEKKRAPRRPGADPVQDQHNPTVMYNGMIAPVVPFGIRGVLWYQGESITSPRELFPRWNELLIADWHKVWGRETLPFFFAQLPALDNDSNSPQVRAWQAEALKIPHTDMIVTIDVGDKKDVHPHNKAPVGDRFARLALAKVYGRALEYSGPVLANVRAQGGAMRLTFTHAPGGLVAKDGPLKTFEITGADGKYVPAEATIEGESIVVRATDVSAPVAVRYAWSRWPEGCNLFNSAGLPAAPFECRSGESSR